MVHAVYFDGTCYFVGSINESVDSDTEIVFRSSNLDLCNEKCDDLNDEAY